VSNPAIGWPVAAPRAQESVNRRASPRRILESISILYLFETFPGERSMEDNQEALRKQNTHLDFEDVLIFE
jgi:hypothetical protein